MSTRKIEHIDINHVKKCLDILQSGNAHAVVGILEKDGSKPKTAFKWVDKKKIKVSLTHISLADVAFFNEYGTEKIPPRSFIRSTFDQKKDSWNSLMEKLVDKILFEKMEVRTALELLAETIKGDIKEKIIEWSQNDHNAPATIAHKGFDSPLIATRQLLNAVDWEVKL